MIGGSAHAGNGRSANLRYIPWAVQPRACSVSWLKRTLRTKDLREANIRAKPVLMGFDQTIARPEALVASAPVRADLSDKEIERLTDYQYASMLAEDDGARAAAPEGERLYRTLSQQLISAGIPVATPFLSGTPPLYGLSDRQVLKATETTEAVSGFGLGPQEVLAGRRRWLSARSTCTDTRPIFQG